MKRTIVILLVTVALSCLLSGCSVKRVSVDESFAGGSGKWQATYTVKGWGLFYRDSDALSYKSSADRVLTLKYLGDEKDLQNVKEFSYEYTYALGGSGMKSLDGAPTAQDLVSKTETGWSEEPSDRTIHVVVTVDGKETEFDLVSTK